SKPSRDTRFLQNRRYRSLASERGQEVLKKGMGRGSEAYPALVELRESWARFRGASSLQRPNGLLSSSPLRETDARSTLFTQGKLALVLPASSAVCQRLQRAVFGKLCRPSLPKET